MLDRASYLEQNIEKVFSCYFPKMAAREGFEPSGAGISDPNSLANCRVRPLHHRAIYR